MHSLNSNSKRLDNLYRHSIIKNGNDIRTRGEKSTDLVIKEINDVDMDGES